MWPEVQKALHEVGLRNISLWIWQNRLFYYAEYKGQEPFADAMARYEKMPRVQEWEELMHTYQVQLPGTKPSSGVWWQACQEIYHQE
jgi:L-rhamnose mutarotase